MNETRTPESMEMRGASDPVLERLGLEIFCAECGRELTIADHGAVCFDCFYYGVTSAIQEDYGVFDIPEVWLSARPDLAPLVPGPGPGQMAHRHHAWTCPPYRGEPPGQ